MPPVLITALNFVGAVAPGIRKVTDHGSSTVRVLGAFR